MVSTKKRLASLLILLAAATAGRASPLQTKVDAAVHRLMSTTGAKGLALAIIDGGEVISVQAYGVRNVQGDPLRTDTVMYGASLTKTVFAYSVLQLVDQGKIALDTPLADYLDKPLTDYDTNAIYPGKPAFPISGGTRPTGNCGSISIRARATAIPAKA